MFEAAMQHLPDLGQVPSLGVLVFSLVVFLRHMDKANTRHELMVQHWHQVMREATEAIRKCAEIIGNNTSAASETQIVLREVSTLLRKMNGKEHKE